MLVRQCISASVGRGWPYQKKKMHYRLSSLFSPSSCPLLAIPLTIWEPGTVIIVTFSWNIVFTTGIIFLQFAGNPSHVTCTPYARFQSLESAKKFCPLCRLVGTLGSWSQFTYIYVRGSSPPPPPPPLQCWVKQIVALAIIIINIEGRHSYKCVTCHATCKLGFPIELFTHASITMCSTDPPSCY